MLSSCYSETLICNTHQRKTERKNSGCNLPCLFVVVDKSLLDIKTPQTKKKPTKKTQPKSAPLSAWSTLNFLSSLLCFYTATGHGGTKQHSILKTENQASLALSNELDAKEISSRCTSPANSVTFLAILLTWHFWSPKYNGTGKREKKKNIPHHPKSTFRFAAY